jgi:hypothetical protein
MLARADAPRVRWSSEEVLLAGQVSQRSLIDGPLTSSAQMHSDNASGVTLHRPCPGLTHGCPVQLRFHWSAI